ncbi:MAG: hypothetical protein EZS28_010134 [Streblomastix strix]|uniref:Uncharacterized protein n=1 Tax=Streblomastix strix TaxID=222440 RepID=A0A5J4WIZ7_9EUKA|nr:MAG: hypothetical protein EZS28_010134 [Streblomastix strix]
MAFEDLTQRFPEKRNTFSKSETQQKMTYAQVANSQEEQLRFFIGHGPKAQLIANSKSGQHVALLPRPSAPQSSVTSKRFLSESSKSTNYSKSCRYYRTHSRSHKHMRHFISSSNSIKFGCFRSPSKDRHHRRHHHQHRHRDCEFCKEMKKIVGALRHSQFDPFKIIPSDSQRRSAESNRRRYENQWSTLKPAEIQPYIQVAHISYVQLTERVQVRFFLHIPLKYLTEIKHWLIIDHPQFSFHPPIITPMISEGASTSKKEGINNNTITNEHKIVRCVQQNHQ